MKRVLALLLTLVLMLSSIAGVAAQTGPSQEPVDPVDGCEYFEETGHNLCGTFLDYWNDNGGLMVFGMPITEAFDEENWDTGETYLVQYFERERMEHHTALAGTEYEVLLGRLGNEVLLQQGRDWLDFPKDDPSEENYFEETGFAVPQVFLDYWMSEGLDLGDPGISFRESLALFGYPISSAEMETNADGDTVLTQWFERARFEHHPDNEPAFQVLLGRLGVEVLANGEEPEPPPPAEPEVTLVPVTDDVSQPRHLTVGPDGAIYVADAGMGGDVCIQVEMPDEGNGDENGDANGDENGDANGDENGDANGDANGDENGDSDAATQQNGDDNGDTPDSDDNGNGDANGDANGDTNGDDNGNGEEASMTVCAGYTGSIVRIVDGESEVVVDGLPSVLIGEDFIGVQDMVVMEDGSIYAVMGWGLGLTLEHREQLGELGEFFGHLVHIDEEGTLTSVADLAEYEFAENPDESLLDANPYAIDLHGDHFVVADAAGNTLLNVSMDGEISLVAVIPVQMTLAPPFLGLPEGTEIPMESVPTDVVVGPDGAYYVAELTGFPFTVGSARVWQVQEDGSMEVYATGFTNISAISFDGEGNLYVLEMVSGSLLGIDPEDPSTLGAAVIKVDADGNHETIVDGAAGLAFATGLVVDADDTIYVSNAGVVPDLSSISRVDWVTEE